MTFTSQRGRGEAPSVPTLSPAGVGKCPSAPSRKGRASQLPRALTSSWALPLTGQSPSLCRGSCRGPPGRPSRASSPLVRATPRRRPSLAPPPPSTSSTIGSWIVSRSPLSARTRLTVTRDVPLEKKKFLSWLPRRTQGLGASTTGLGLNSGPRRSGQCPPDGQWSLLFKILRLLPP